MMRLRWLVLALLAGVVMAHDLSMAAMGHPVPPAAESGVAQAPARHDAGSHHRDDATPASIEAAPESCGTVRLAPARQDVPDRSPLPDPVLGPGFEAWQTALRAISANLLANPVPHSPSTCLARFQVFRI